MDLSRTMSPLPAGEFPVDAASRTAAETPVPPAAARTQPIQDRWVPHAGNADVSSPPARATSTASLAMTAVGVVFGDIGTSPLYAFSVALSATGQALPVAADVFGIVSLIFWALIVMVSLKYVVLILRADNDGEGGILALLSLVAGDRIAWSPKLPLLVILGVAGAALLYGDGVITPAISVLSAMEGLKLIAPHFDQFIVPVTIAILDRAVPDPAARHPKHRQAVRAGDARLVRRHRSAWRGQHLGGP